MVFAPGSVGQASLSATSPRVGDGEAGRRQVGELRMLRRRVHLGLAELDQRAVDLGEQQEAAEGAALAQTAGALRLLGRDHPGGPLDFLERAPAGGDAADYDLCLLGLFS